MRRNNIQRFLMAIGFIIVCFNVGIIEHAADEVYTIDSKQLPHTTRVITSEEEYFRLDRKDIGGLLVYIIFLLMIIIVVLIANILQRQKAEGLLRQSEKNYKELLMSIPHSVILLKKKEIKFINQYGIEFFGGTGEKEITYLVLKESLAEDIDWGIIGTHPKRIETKIKTSHNEIKEVELTLVTKSKNGVKDEIIILIEDISDKKLLYEKTQRDKIRNEFFANLSHEFKTPINLMLSTAQLLEQIQNNKEEMKRILPNAIRIFNQNAYRLIRLVNNIIDSTMMDSGLIKLDLHNCNIVELTEDITLSTVKYAEDNNIEILFDTEVEELEMALDLDKYERTILNLISNAIKYNKKDGQILVSLYVKEKEIAISIKDTGIGISKELLPYIFERFMQVNKSLTRSAEGSGVGLSLVKMFVDLHQGRIEVGSTEGQGSEFVIYLPIYTVEEKEDSVIRALLYRHQERNTKIELADIYIKQY